jgi:hypothetical protein
MVYFHRRNTPFFSDLAVVGPMAGKEGVGGGSVKTTAESKQLSLLCTAKVETVEIHHLIPGGDEIAHEFLTPVVLGIDLG